MARSTLLKSICLITLLIEAVAWTGAASAANEQPAPPAAASSTEEPSEVTAPSDEFQTILPADIAPDQLIMFFTAISESEAMGAELDPFIEEMLTPGPKVENWRDLGVDILEELRALPGGISGNLLLDLDQEFPGVSDLSGQAAPELHEFHSYALRPEPVGHVSERSYSSFASGFWFEIATQRFQQGKALCFGGHLGITLHSKRPLSEWSRNELMFIAFAFALADRTSGLEICTVHMKAGEGRYSNMSFLPDGSTLPVLSADSKDRVIMAAAGLSDYLRDTVPIQSERE